MHFAVVMSESHSVIVVGKDSLILNGRYELAQTDWAKSLGHNVMTR